MVEREFGTDHPQFQGAKVSIEIHVDGETTAQPEFPIPDGIPDHCYVQSELNKQYQIVFTVTNPNEINDPKNRYPSGCIHPNVRISIDGSEVKSFYLPQRGTTSAKGKVEGGSELRFQFAAPKIVFTGGLLRPAEVEQLGTIKVEIWLSRIEREIQSVSPVEEEVKHEVVHINEKAKKGVFVSAATTFGAKTKFVGRIVHSTNLTLFPLVIHTFHYKTLDFLEMEGIIIGDDHEEEEEVPVGKALPFPHPPAKRKVADPDSGIEKKVKEEVVKPPDSSSKANPRTHNNNQLVDLEFDETVEFVSIQPAKKKLIEVIDLTTEPRKAAPKIVSRIESSEVIDLTNL
ncbi:hypothetical protein BDR26DRAFT_914939 [Obelidium mucronatum]|nr:hypothetical protein BDR26DRAFT_914939 [Obelidium mucronatum]